MLAVMWQEDVGKKGREMANPSTLVHLFYGIPVFLPSHHNSAFLQGKENYQT